MNLNNKQQLQDRDERYEGLRKSVTYMQQHQIRRQDQVDDNCIQLIDQLGKQVNQLESISLANLEMDDLQHSNKLWEDMQNAKQQAIDNLEQYFDDLFFQFHKNQSNEQLKNIQIQRIQQKIQQIQSVKGSGMTVEQFNKRNFVSFEQDSGMKIQEMMMHQNKQKSEPLNKEVKLVVNEEMHQKLKTLMPEYAYIGKASDEYAQSLDINVGDYFESVDPQQKIMVVINDNTQVMSVYNPDIKAQKALKLNVVDDIPYQHSLVVTDSSQIMICGGLNLSTGDITDSCYMFNGDRMCLESKQSMLVKRVGHAICYLDQFIYVIGGKTNQMVCSKLCERYDINQDRWEPISNLNYGRSRAGVTTFKHNHNTKSIYIFYGNDSIQITNHTIEKYSLQSGIWEVINLQFHMKRIETTGMGCCQINESEIVIFGGFYEEKLDNSKSQTIFSNKVGIYDVNNQSVKMSSLDLPCDYNNTNSSQPIISNGNVLALGHFMQEKNPNLVRCLDVDYVLSISQQKSEVIIVLDQLDPNTK